MPTAEPTVYLDGEYVPSSAALVPIDDRGFLFSDACYEVTLVVDGRSVALDRHLARLQRGLDELRIGFDASTLVEVHDQLIRRNRLDLVPWSSVYVHVTRGVAPRAHGFPVGASPTVVVRSQAVTVPSPEMLERGTRAITSPDIRWGRVDLKTTGLLPNVLAQQGALDAGVEDVILHRDGAVTEGSHTNVFGVIDDVLVTAPADRRILAGVVRGLVLELARDAGVVTEQRTWSPAEMAAADEVIMTSTTAGVRPIVEIDGRAVGAGVRGPVTASLQAAYAELLATIRRGRSDGAIG
jgi:D-alanine transaminase